LNERFESGLKTRKEVLGSDYVENSIRNATDFDRPFQEFITTSAWDGVWNRGPLDRKTKSLITLSVLVALRAEDEIALHLRGAINNGLTPDEIMAMLIRPLSLTLRLAGNMMGGHLALIIFTMFIITNANVYGNEYSYGYGILAGLGTSVFSVPLSIGIILLEILIAFIQAYVFALLTAVYIGMAVNVDH